MRRPYTLFVTLFGLWIEKSSAFVAPPPKRTFLQTPVSIHRNRFTTTTTHDIALCSASTDESITPTPSSFVNGSNDTAPLTPKSHSSSSFFVPSVNEPIDASLLALPRHSHYAVNEILTKAEATLKALHKHAHIVESTRLVTMQDDNTGPCHERVFANSYVDLGKVDTVGFDYDYTLVTYTEELLELIYDMALKRLVQDRQYPMEMLTSGLCFNPRFPIRGEYYK
jgi:hypothetical protein